MNPDVVVEVLQAATEAIIVVNEDGDIVLANARAEDLFGYGPRELVGQKVEMLMPEALRAKHGKQRARYGKAPRSRPLVSGLNLKAQRKNGQVFEAEIALTPIETDDGLLVSSAIREISADGTSEAYFRNILESAPDAMIIIDQHGRIAVVNSQAEKMFGYDRKALLGQAIELLLPERLRDRHIAHRAAFATEPQLRPMGSGLELAGRRRDGSEFPVEISLSPFASASGTFISSVIRDVTERKAMERDLIEARQHAERANKANTAFLAAASHDLRQPVQALALLNGALRRTVGDARALEMIDSQQTSLDAMTNLLNSLLDISRLDAGKVEPQFEVFRIQRLVDRLGAEFARQARHKKLSISFDTCDTVVRSDPNLLGEIIQNFVSNAIRYTESGTVTLRCREHEDSLWLDISDTGIGIAADQQDEIFNEFHQLRTPGVEKEGFGLGLAIVRRLADLLGHELRVQSEPGVGSTFSVRVPVVGASEIAEPGTEAVASGSVGEVSGSIILVEDDLNVARAWSMLLDAEGYHVATAASVSEVNALLPGMTDPPDLIISDFHLAEESTGLQAVRAVRKHFGIEIPAFIVTGDTSKLIDEAESAKNCITLNKPVNTDLLLQHAERAISTGLVPEA